MIHLVVPSDARAARNLEAVAQARYGDDLSRLTLYGIALDPASERDLQADIPSRLWRVRPRTAAFVPFQGGMDCM